MINVLIVDDDAMVAELNRRYVAQISGFHCCGTASTLEKAKEFIFNSENHIDLILLDIYMQQENGLICCLSHTAQAAKATLLSFLLPLTPLPLKIRFTTAWWII